MTEGRIVKGRFAPSPTGRMHAGNIFSALCAWLIAKSQGGSIVLRIEDLDRDRSKPEFIDLVQRDLEALGLTWDEGPYFQSSREEAYEEAFRALSKAGLVYPCFCTRADLHSASAPHAGERFVYARTCHGLTREERTLKAAIRPPAHRLLVPDAQATIEDAIQGAYAENLLHDSGDFIIRRSDGSFAYQLAVVVDDAAQGVTSVVRGADLLSSCGQQRYLQDVLGLPHVEYAHVPLIVDEQGRRLAKRSKDAEMEALLARFGSPKVILGHIAGLTGLMPTTEPASAEDILRNVKGKSLRQLLKDPHAVLFR